MSLFGALNFNFKVKCCYNFIAWQCICNVSSLRPLGVCLLQVMLVWSPPQPVILPPACWPPLSRSWGVTRASNGPEYAMEVTTLSVTLRSGVWGRDTSGATTKRLHSHNWCCSFQYTSDLNKLILVLNLLFYLKHTKSKIIQFVQITIFCYK